MTAKHSKDKVVYSYRKSLEEELANAKVELEEKRYHKRREFLKWQKEEAEKAYNSYEQRITDLQNFIKLAEEKLAEIDKKTT